jgi:hypothetical protein
MTRKERTEDEEGRQERKEGKKSKHTVVCGKQRGRGEGNAAALQGKGARNEGKDVGRGGSKGREGRGRWE